MGCQLIRWDITNQLLPRVMGCYKSNAPTVLFPAYCEWKPIDPAALTAEIILSCDLQRDILSSLNHQDADTEHKFKFIFAHELVHAFDLMKLTVPAFMDWDAFWKNVLHEGSLCHIANERYNYHSLFIDDYGQTNEMESVGDYWPSKAKEWFNACR